MKTRIILLVAALAVVSWVVAPAIGSPDKTRSSATEDDKKKAETNKAEADKPVVYTNEDLTRLFGEAEPASEPGETATESAPAEDPLAVLEEDKKSAAKRAEAVREAERQVEAAAANVRKLERRALAIRNPYLKRPEVDLTEEEAKAWKGMGASERARTTAEQLEEARKRLEEARRQLDRLRASR